MKIAKPGRCGTCKNFPGNKKRCPQNTRAKMTNVYANDYGKGHCDNYHRMDVKLTMTGSKRSP